MSIITCFFVALAFINGITSAPVDDSSSLKPPAAIISSSTTEINNQPLGGTTKQVPVPKDHYSWSSEESKESAESSEENKKRTVRENIEINGHQTKDLPQGVVLQPPAVIKEPATPATVTKEAAIPQLPAREIRETNVPIPAVISSAYDLSTSSTPASTTAAKY